MIKILLKQQYQNIINSVKQQTLIQNRVQLRIVSVLMTVLFSIELLKFLHADLGTVEHASCLAQHGVLSGVVGNIL